MEKEALFRRFDYGGVYRFEKNKQKVPMPFEIDIWNPIDFEYPYVPFCLRPHECIPVFAHPPLILQDHGSEMPGMIPEISIDPTDDLFPGMIREEML